MRVCVCTLFFSLLLCRLLLKNYCWWPLFNADMEMKWIRINKMIEILGLQFFGAFWDFFCPLPQLISDAGPQHIFHCPWDNHQWIRTVVCTYGPNSSSMYPPFLDSLEGVLESVPSKDFLILLGDFNTHVGNHSETWRDWEEYPPPIWAWVVLCYWTSLLVTDCP